MDKIEKFVEIPMYVKSSFYHSIKLKNEYRKKYDEDIINFPIDLISSDGTYKCCDGKGMARLKFFEKRNSYGKFK